MWGIVAPYAKGSDWVRDLKVLSSCGRTRSHSKIGLISAYFVEKFKTFGSADIALKPLFQMRHESSLKSEAVGRQMSSKFWWRAQLAEGLQCLEDICHIAAVVFWDRHLDCSRTRSHSTIGLKSTYFDEKFKTLGSADIALKPLFQMRHESSLNSEKWLSDR